MMATVSVPLLKDESELDWKVATADGRRAVVFAEVHTNVGMLLIGGEVVNRGCFSYLLAAGCT